MPLYYATMLGILPFVTFLVIFIFLRLLHSEPSWRRVFIIAAILWGTYLVLVTELLSLFKAITQVALVIAWLLPILVCIALIIPKVTKNYKFRIKIPRYGFDPFDFLLLTGLLFFIGTTASVAWLAPPQTWDSLNYHLPRVAQWAQNRSVDHFVTGIDWQNSMTPGAEFAILHLYVLAGSDRLVNFVQWLAMCGSLVVVSTIAKQLGADRRGQYMSMIVAVTIPTGLVQASCTMTDYVVAFWVLCAASEVIAISKDQPSWESILYANLAAGLAILTKPTAVPYLLPFVLIAGWSLFKHISTRRALQWIVVSCFLVLILNVGHWTRNYQLYGNPISGKERIAQQANQLMNLQGMLSNVLRNAHLHAGTPKQAVNQWVFDQVSIMHQWLNADINDPRTTSHGPYNPIGGFALHEDVVGNLFHGLLILASIVTMIVFIKKVNRFLLVYSLVVIATFFLFSFLFKWQIFGGRYHQAFFLMFTPVISIFSVRFLKPTGAKLLCVALFLAAYPWLFSINSRPLIPIQGRSTTESILIVPRQDLYFVNAKHLEKPYRTITALIEQANCSTVGLMLFGNSAEYPLWVLLGAPRQDLTIEWIVGGEQYERYKNPAFQPCAIICEGCPAEWITLRNLPIVFNEHTFQLYLQTYP